jgi:hypothetical protein
MFKGWQLRVLIACSLVLLGVAGRILPHPPNFTPVAACALFCGFLLGTRAAMPVILVTMIASDWLIGGYEVRTMAAVYASLAFSAFIGKHLVAHPSVGRVVCGSLASSVLFFVVSNGAVWAFSGFYRPGWQGAVECFVAAAPFFRYTVLGDLFWASALFGTYAVATIASRRYSFGRAWAPIAGSGN